MKDQHIAQVKQFLLDELTRGGRPAELAKRFHDLTGLSDQTFYNAINKHKKQQKKSNTDQAKAALVVAQPVSVSAVHPWHLLVPPRAIPVYSLCILLPLSPLLPRLPISIPRLNYQQCHSHRMSKPSMFLMAHLSLVRLLHHHRHSLLIITNIIILLIPRTASSALSLLRFSSLLLPLTRPLLRVHLIHLPLSSHLLRHCLLKSLLPLLLLFSVHLGPMYSHPIPMLVLELLFLMLLISPSHPLLPPVLLLHIPITLFIC